MHFRQNNSTLFDTFHNVKFIASFAGVNWDILPFERGDF